MSYAALFSGGKDSTYAIWKAQEAGLNVESLITVYPKRKDSYMFHKPNLDFVPDIAESLGLKLVKIQTEGEKEAELDDLKGCLKDMDLEGIITGAVKSSYQYDRIENLSSGLDMEHYAPLWQMDPLNLLNELIENEFKTVIVSAAAMGFDESWLGREIDEACILELNKLNEKYGINVAGEGGEYETFVLDAPNYRWGFEITYAEKSWKGYRGEYSIKEVKKKCI